MAGLIAALFGGRSRPPDTDPQPGIGGYAAGAGPANQTGFPGSTSQVRTFGGNNPRGPNLGRSGGTGIRSDTNTGFEQGLSTDTQRRQASYRGDIKPDEPGRSVASANPRLTGAVVTRRPILRQIMQQDPGEFFGGPMLRTGPGNETAGGVITKDGAVRSGGGPQAAGKDTTTLWKDAGRVLIGEGTPGAQNVRNRIALRYKNAPGQEHTYKSAPRADQAPVNKGGQATDGNVHPERAVQEVSVPNRFQMAGTGNLSWAVLRQMPYTGRGDGARGADLNGQRYYAVGQTDQFWNAGQGDYGIARQRGSQVKRPVSFTQPAPWTAQFYDTTDEVGTTDQPAQPGQAPNLVYVSPSSGRASNSTGRTG